ADGREDGPEVWEQGWFKGQLLVVENAGGPPLDRVFDIVLQLCESLLRVGIRFLGGVQFGRSLEVGANRSVTVLLARAAKRVLHLVQPLLGKVLELPADEVVAVLARRPLCGISRPQPIVEGEAACDR